MQPVGDDAAFDRDENIGQKILGGGVWRVIAFILATGVAVISTSVVSRAIGPVEFATFTTGLSLIAIAQSLSDVGLLALGVREFAALSGEARVRSQRALITLRLIFSVVGSVGIVVFVILSGYSSGFVLGMTAAVVGLCVFSLHVSFNVPLQATYRLNTLAVLEVSRQVMASLLIIVVAVEGGGVGVIIATFLPVAIIFAIASGVLARKITPIAPSWDPPAMRGLLTHVGVFAVAASAGNTYAYIAQVVSNSILNGYESGQFALAFRIYAVLISGCMVAVSGAFPLLVISAKEDAERMVYATRRLVQTTALVGAASAVLLTTGAWLAVAVLGGPRFHDAARLIAIISLALPASFVLITGSTVLLAAGRHRELIVISIGGALISIAATSAMAAAFGGDGAAAGIVFGETVLASGYLFVVRQIDHRALPEARWGLGLLFAVGIGCVVALLPLPGLVNMLVGTSAFLIATFALRLLPPELIALAPRPGRRGVT